MLSLDASLPTLWAATPASLPVKQEGFADSYAWRLESNTSRKRSLKGLLESSWKATAELAKLSCPVDPATCRNTLAVGDAIREPRNEPSLPSIADLDKQFSLMPAVIGHTISNGEPLHSYLLHISSS